MKSVNACILGFGKMPADCAKILLDKGKKISFVLETEEAVFSVLQAFCQKVGLSYKKTTSKETLKLLGSVNEPTVIFSINNNYIFPLEIIKKVNLRIINFHNSFLPSYKGHGQVIPSWVIFNGEKKHGVTWHLVDEDIDKGNILCQDKLEIAPDDTALSLSVRCIEIGTELFKKNLESFFDFSNIGIHQENQKADVYSHELMNKVYRKSDIPNGGYLNLDWDFNKCSRFLRSLDYFPFAVLPLPKIVIGGIEYAIKKYYIEGCSSEKETAFASQREVILEESRLIINFNEGCLKLLLTKVRSG